MTTSDTILNLLATDQSTTDAIAEALQQPAVIIAAFCCDLETAGLATSHALGDPDKGRKLITWRITAAGRDRAISLSSAH
jgi:predicted ArsR family transcriptional regulator